MTPSTPVCFNCGTECGRYDRFCSPGCEADFPTVEESAPFRLEQPKPERRKPDFSPLVKRVQKPLFIGADDLPGQSYLFE